MTEIDQEPKPKKSKQRPPSNGQIITMPDSSISTKKPETVTKPKPSRLSIEQFTDQPKQAKTVRLPIELCTMLERAKHWQSLEGKKPNTEQDIIAEAVINWLNSNQHSRTPTASATNSE
jgi:hypothetical protein